jgi:hypothetical protein
MAVDGKWNMTMSTPMGERRATLELKTAGGALLGTQGDETGSAEIFEGTVSADDVAWKVSITNPTRLTLAFTGKVSGDSTAAKWVSARWAAFRSRQRGPKASVDAIDRLLARSRSILKPAKAVVGKAPSSVADDAWLNTHFFGDRARTAARSCKQHYPRSLCVALGSARCSASRLKHLAYLQLQPNFSCWPNHPILE